MLYMIGLGFMPGDVSVRALKAIKACKSVYLDAYTSVIVSYENMRQLMEDVIERTDLIQCDRSAVEQGEDNIINDAKINDVAFLVAGDVFCATTHTNLYIKASQQNIKVIVMHNASIINAISCTGLEMYRFGRTISIPIFTDNWRPSSFLEYYLDNRKSNLHTLVLLQMSTKELEIKAYCKGIERYSDPYYLLPNQAAQQIISLLDEFPETFGCIGKELPIVVCCRVGTDTQFIEATTLTKCAARANDYYGAPMYALVIPSDTIAEQELNMLRLFTNDMEVVSALEKATK